MSRGTDNAALESLKVWITIWQTKRLANRVAFVRFEKGFKASLTLVRSPVLLFERMQLRVSERGPATLHINDHFLIAALVKREVAVEREVVEKNRIWSRHDD